MRMLLALAAILSASCATAAPPKFTIADVEVNETDGNAVLTITKSAKAPSYSKVRVYTADRTAKSPADYRATDVTLTFANSQLSAKVNVPVYDDTIAQGKLTFAVNISSVRNASIARTPAVVTINDNDVPPPPVIAWKDCATEGQICAVVGTATVRYMAPGAVNYAFRVVTGSVSCSNDVFGDPSPGIVKICQTDGEVAPPPVVIPPPNPCYGADGLPIISSQCPAKTCPGIVNPVPAEQTCPPPPVASAGSCAQASASPNWQERFCVASKVCADYRSGQPGFVGPSPKTIVGARYHVVRGDFWTGGLDATKVVAWPSVVVPYQSWPDVTNWPGGVYFDASCFT